MKKLLLLFVSVLLLTSCDKEDDSTNDTSNTASNTDLFVGTWTMTDLQSQASASYAYLSQSFETPITISGKDINVELIISEDPNEYNSDGSLTVITEFTDPFGNDISEETETQSLEELEAGTWEIIGDTILFTSVSGEISTLIIESIDENNLVLKEMKNETETNSDFGVELDVTLSTESTFTFVK